MGSKIKSLKNLFKVKHFVKNAFSNKPRIILTFLGIMVSALLLTIVALYLDTAYKELNLSYSGLPKKTAIITGNIKYDEIFYFSEDYPDIEIINYRLDNGTLDSNDQIITRIIGINNDFLNSFVLDLSNGYGIYTAQLSCGRFFSENEMNGFESAIIINESTALYLFGKANPLNRILSVRINNRIKNYVIIGTIKDSYNSAQSYINFLKDKHINYNINIYTPQRNLINTSNDYNFSLLYHKEKSLDSLAKSNLIINPETGYFKKSAVETLSYNDKVNEYSTSLNIINSISRIILIIVICEALIISLFMIFSIKERIPEIGIRKALGASDFQIMIQFIGEYFIISNIASVFGILLACIMFGILLLIKYIKYAFIFTSISFMPIFLTYLFIISLTLILSFIPAIISRKINIIDALRFE